MTSGITLSAGVRQNLLALQQTGTLSATTQNRLATGKKVNSALDNPTNFFTSSSLSARSNDLSSLLDSMSNGIKTLEAADNGLTSITKTVESMQSTLRQARQDKSFQSVSYDMSQVDPASPGKLTLSGGSFTTATDINLTTTGSGQYVNTTAAYAAPSAAAASVLTGAADLSTGAVNAGTLTVAYGGASVDIAITGHVAGDNQAAVLSQVQAGLVGTALDGKVAATVNASHQLVLTAASNEDAQITVTDDVNGTADSLVGINAPNKVGTQGSNGLTEFSVNGTSISLNTTSTGDTLDHAVATINTALSAAGVKFQAYKAGPSSTKLGIRATTTDAGSLAIGGTDAGLFGTKNAVGVVGGSTSASLTLAQTVDNLVSSINSNSALKDNVKASNDNGKLRLQNLSTADLSVAGAKADGHATGVATDVGTIGGNDVRKDLVSQFNGFRDQLDKLSDDASFNGINLLRGDKLKITFNENATSSIDIQAKDSTGAVRAINASNLDIATAVNKDFDSDTTIDSKLDKLSTALNTLRSQAGSFGSNLAIVQNRQDFTQSMMTTLQTGADNLVLADTNEEGANMLALQTRQQLSTTALSMANQANQAVLRLF
jgi:flagellin